MSYLDECAEELGKLERSPPKKEKVSPAVVRAFGLHSLGQGSRFTQMKSAQYRLVLAQRVKWYMETESATEPEAIEWVAEDMQRFVKNSKYPSVPTVRKAWTENKDHLPPRD